MKVIRPPALPKKDTTTYSVEDFTQNTDIPRADPDNLALAGVNADTFQPRYEALYRKWVTGLYHFRVDSEFGRSLCSWLSQYPLKPLTIAVIADNPEYVKQLKMGPLEAVMWFDRACVAGSEQVATYLQATYQFDWNDDNFLFAKVGASNNIGWLTTLAHQLKLSTLPDNTYRFVDNKQMSLHLNALDVRLANFSDNCQPS